MRVAFATCSQLPDGWTDDLEAAALLEADFCVWDDPAVDWRRYDRVVVRSVFDYQHRVEEFLDWSRQIGASRLRNSPELVAFNADKRYLAELSLPTIPTMFVAPGDPLPALRGEVVVKPHVSAGARDTGRFGPAAHDGAIALLERIRSRGCVALVQPYLAEIDRLGETALVFFAGRLSHVLRKRAVLRADEVAPPAREGAAGELGVAAAMLEEDLVVAGEADAAQIELAQRALGELRERFGTPLFLRVDLVDDGFGAPVVMELEAIDPVLYMASCPGAAASFAAAVAADR
jgi:hypothetical protein